MPKGGSLVTAGGLAGYDHMAWDEEHMTTHACRRIRCPYLRGLLKGYKLKPIQIFVAIDLWITDVNYLHRFIKQRHVRGFIGISNGWIL